MTSDYSTDIKAPWLLTTSFVMYGGQITPKTKVDIYSGKSRSYKAVDLKAYLMTSKPMLYKDDDIAVLAFDEYTGNEMDAPLNAVASQVATDIKGKDTQIHGNAVIIPKVYWKHYWKYIFPEG